MFAVDHAATALLIKRRFPSVSLTPMLLSVQAMELARVGLNYLGVERTTTETFVRSVAEIHLEYMPFSHSVATAVGGALLGGFSSRRDWVGHWSPEPLESASSRISSSTW